MVTQKFPQERQEEEEKQEEEEEVAWRPGAFDPKLHRR